MGSSFTETPAPEVAPGFQQFVDRADLLGGAGTNALLPLLFGGYDVGGALQGIPGFETGRSALEQFAVDRRIVPQGYEDVVQQLQDLTTPAAQRAFDVGRQGILEANAAAGIPLTSSATGRQLGDLSADIFGGQSAQVGASAAQLLPQILGQQLSAASQLYGQGFQESQFQRSLPIQTINAGTGLLAQTPIFQPSLVEQESPFAPLLGAGGQLASAYLGGSPINNAGKGAGSGGAGKAAGTGAGAATAGGLAATAVPTAGILPALVGVCWVAREIFGVNDPRWLDARRYVVSGEDEELRAVYLTHGPRLAAAVRQHPALRTALTPVFQDMARKGRALREVN